MTKILILEANPRSDLKTSDEIRDLQEIIKQSRSSDGKKFEVRLQPSARSTDLHTLIQNYEPEIIHFCGHGTEDDGLVLRDKVISKEALLNLFNLSKKHLKCVVLNSISSDGNNMRCLWLASRSQLELWLQKVHFKNFQPDVAIAKFMSTLVILSIEVQDPNFSMILTSLSCNLSIYFL